MQKLMMAYSGPDGRFSDECAVMTSLSRTSCSTCAYRVARSGRSIHGYSPGATLLLMLLALVSLLASTETIADPVKVRNTAELTRAIQEANSSGGSREIRLSPGIYTLSGTLQIKAPDISLTGNPDDASAVIIQGDRMHPDARVPVLISVQADRFQLNGVTLQKARYHLLQVKGELDADDVLIRNCVLRDSYQQLIKVSTNNNDRHITSDGGRIENCVFEYSAGIGPQHYIGGIDAHRATNWVVSGNVFRNIASPGHSVAEHAIHFWNDSADNIIERNLIIDCDRAIGFGMGKRGNSGGIIRNNMIYHSKAAGHFGDVSISIENSPGTKIYNNTIFHEHGYPNAIEFRFEGTSDVLVANNLTNRRIVSRNNASANLVSNITDVTSTAFVDAAAGNLHIVPGATHLIDSAVSLSGLSTDFDGDPRPHGPGSDIGADEILGIR